MAKEKKAAKGESAGGYKNHRAGSPKGRVHQRYDEKGRDAAIALGLKLELKESTLKNWIGNWRREDEGGSTKASKKKASKEKASKKSKRADDEDEDEAPVKSKKSKGAKSAKSEKVKTKKKKSRRSDDDEVEELEEAA